MIVITECRNVFKFNPIENFSCGYQFVFKPIISLFCVSSSSSSVLLHEWVILLRYCRFMHAGNLKNGCLFNGVRYFWSIEGYREVYRSFYNLTFSFYSLLSFVYGQHPLDTFSVKVYYYFSKKFNGVCVVYRRGGGAFQWFICVVYGQGGAAFQA